MTVFFFGFLVFLSYRMSEALCTWMSGDDERMHKLSVWVSNASQFEKDFRGALLYDLAEWS